VKSDLSTGLNSVDPGEHDVDERDIGLVSTNRYQRVFGGGEGLYDKLLVA
jgi:hypothetical protein